MKKLNLLMNRNIEGFGKEIIKTGILRAESENYVAATDLFELGIDMCVSVKSYQNEFDLSNINVEKLIVDELEIDRKSYDELFAKAFLLSLFDDDNEQEESREIAEYLHSKYHNEYTFFLLNFTLCNLERYMESHRLLMKEDYYWIHPYILFLKGHVNRLQANGIADFYQALIANNSSPRCARLLFAGTRSSEIFSHLANKKVDDTITSAFLDPGMSEEDFEQLYMLSYQNITFPENRSLLNYTNEGKPLFIEFLKQNEYLFLLFRDLTQNELEQNEPEDCDDVDNNFIGSTRKYGGYNGFDDRTIDDAFEGDPENTWNVD